MPLPKGTRLSAYEILAPLGAGGMGEVYRAKDTQLKREVALKVLTDTFVHDPDRMSRFQREAEVLAALNHPGIAAIYGLEAGALIMELVEGETLPSPLPFDTALRYARQIAEALEYAHEHGVIHRDLKPANIKVTSEGVVKLLDFGLAKAIEGQVMPAGDPAKSPTLTLEMTGVGVVMGTAAYMSPEQAGGRVADRRADIWSFGAVFYEMLSGKRAFEGESITETLASVLKVEPNFAALPPSTPASIRRLVRRCLMKDRKQRLQAIGDARIAIEEALAGAGAEEIPAPVAGSHRSILPWMIAVGVLSVVAMAGWWAAWRLSQPVDHALLRFSVDLGPDALTNPNVSAAISPDGTRLVFGVRGPDGKSQLATRLLDQPQVTLLAGTEGGLDPFFKPDGEWIGFLAEGKLKKVSVRGSAVINLCDALEVRGASWGDDDTIIATLDSNTGVGLSRIPAAGGTPEAVTNPSKNGEATHRWPQILPGGQAVLFTANKKAATFDDASIEVLSLKTGEVKVVQSGGYFGRYLPGGYLVYVHERTLFGVPFDLDRMEVRGTPSPLQGDVAGNSTTAGGQFDFSRNGTLVYLSGKAATGTSILEWLDITGKTEPLLAAPGIYFQPRLSPDGKRLAFSNNTDIEILDWERGIRARLATLPQTTNFSPVWTPDGKHIVFSSQGTSNDSLQWIRADGAGEAHQLLESKGRLRSHSISTDGKRLAFSQRSRTTGMDLWTLSLDTSDPEHPKAGKPELFLGTPFNEDQPAFSPDGRWIAYASNESGQNEIYVRPFPVLGPSGSGKWPISAGGGQMPIWSRDGRELFYGGANDRIMAVACTAKGDTFSAGKPHPWSDNQSSSYGGRDRTPDGKRFVISADSGAQQKGSVHVTFLVNFFDEVRRRLAPVR